MRLFSLFLIAVCGVTAAQTLAPAPNTSLVALTPPGHFSEPAVAVNPAAPEEVLAAFQVNATIAYSHDGGKNWSRVDVAPPAYKRSGDVSVAWDGKGRAYVCFIAFDKLGTMNYWAKNASRNGVFIRRSDDGGKTWGAPVAVAEQPTKAGIPFEDKPVIVADPKSGTLYVGWTRWTLSSSPLVVAHSTDGGETWSSPVEVQLVPGMPRDDNGANEGFAGTIDADGTLYAVWAEGTHIVLTSSRDGGAHFSAARNILETGPLMYVVQGFSRSNGFPQIAADPEGALYVAWSDYRNGDVDVFLSKSSDKGATWSPAMRVNTDDIHDGTDQFYPALSVDPKDGTVNVLFYDRRGDPTNARTLVTLARSTDHGASFQNYRWTEQPFVANGEFMGDYSGLAAFGGRVYGVWAEATAVAKEEARKPHTLVRVGVADFASAAKSSGAQ